MIQFSEIFDKAVYLFDDPDIRMMYANDRAGYHRIMRPLLINGLHYFTSPTAITDRLSSFSGEQGYTETPEFGELSVGSDSTVFTLCTTPVEGCAFSCRVGKQMYPVSYEENYDKKANTFEIPAVVKEGDSVEVSWYYAGAFTADFSHAFRSDFPMDSIMEKVKNILAHAVLVSWGDVEMNRALGLRNLLSDADLATYSPANSARALTEWHNQLNRDMDTLISELNWRVMATPKGGSRFGQ